MRPIITLSGIDEALSNLNFSNKNSLKYRLVNAIRQYYTEENEVESLKEIDTDELVRLLWDTGDDPVVIRNRRKNLSSIKSSINSDFEDLYRNGLNSEGVIIGPNNVFDMSDEAKSKILETFTYNTSGEGPVPLGKLTEVLKIVSDILSKDESGMETDDPDDSNRFEQLKNIIRRISEIIGISTGNEANSGDQINITYGEGKETNRGADDNGPVSREDRRIAIEKEPDKGDEIEDAEEDEEFEEIVVDETPEEAAKDETEEVPEEEEIIEDVEPEEDLEEIEDEEELEEPEPDEVEEIEEVEDEDLEEVELEEVPEEEIEEVESEGEVEEIDADDGLEEVELEVEPEEDVEEIDSDEELEEVEVDEGLEDEEIIEEAEPEEEVEEVDVEEVPEEEIMEESEPEEDAEEVEDDGEIEEVGPEDEIEEVEEDEAIDEVDLEEIPEEEIEEAEETEADEDLEEIVPEEDVEEIDSDEELEEVEVDEGLEDEEIIEEAEPEEEVEEVDVEEVPEEEILEELEPEEELEPDESEEVEDLEEDEDLEEVDLEEVPEDEIADEEDLEELGEEIVEHDFALEDLLEEYGDEGYQGEDGIRKARLLAEGFNHELSAMDRYYNQYILIPEGEYLAGSRIPRKNANPGKIVRLESFYFGKFPVTNALFEIFIEKTGYVTTAERLGYGTVYYGRYQRAVDPETGMETFDWNSALVSKQVEGACWYQPFGPGSTLHKKRIHPVVQVSREDAMAFAAWTGKRLPSEGEWEAASRTVQGYEFPWGGESKKESCNIEESCIGDTTPVDKYKDYANSIGIVDTMGNVMEWTLDRAETSQGENQGTKSYIVKGGSWISGNDLLLSSRFVCESETTSNILGFRCVAY